MPSEKRRIQERERQLKEAAKRRTSLPCSDVLRNQCGQERLSDLLLLSIEDIPIDKEEVLKASLLKLCIFKMSIWRNLSVT
ncbi:unnamed protein product [Arctogadus glacialis]